MPEKLFADIHLHPAMRPFCNNTGSNWEAYCYSDEFKEGKNNKTFKKVVEAQLLSERGTMYDQAGYPKLLNGGVRLVFAALYPLEKGFIFKPEYTRVNPEKPNDPHEIVSDRRILLKGFTKYPQDKLDYMAEKEYWQLLKEEYEYYWLHSTNREDKSNKVKSGSEREIRFLLDDKRLPMTHKQAQKYHRDTYHIRMRYNVESGIEGRYPYRTMGKYTIIDKDNPPPASLDGFNGNTIYTVLTMEGMGIVTQKKSRTSWFPLAVYDKQTILSRIKSLKKKTPLFFVTFCHHFDNGVCGHARSFIRFAKALKMNQSARLDGDFTPMGKEILLNLLSIKKNASGDYVNDFTNAGRRIFIDMKHMSFNGRKTVINIVSKYNKKHPNKKIPLISSHSGYSGFSKAEMAARVRDADNPEHNPNREFGVSQSKYVKFKELGIEMRYNSWSINLATEEVRDIVDSGGLIGLSFEQNILGVAFIGGKKDMKIEKKKKQRESQKEVRQKYVMLVAGQLLKMAQISGTADFWKCISIGTDFDGLINPVDGFSSVLFFDLIREKLIDVFKGLDPNLRHDEFHLPRDDNEIEQVIDDFCFNNAARFLQTHFDSARMPSVSAFLSQASA